MASSTAFSAVSILPTTILSGFPKTVHFQLIGGHSGHPAEVSTKTPLRGH